MTTQDDCPFVGSIPDPSHAYRRVKTLALSACIQAGGRPCWVAAHAPEGSPAAPPIGGRPPRRSSLPPQYRPRRGPLARPASPAARSDSETSSTADAPAAAGLLSDRELVVLAGCKPALLASIARALNRVSQVSPAFQLPRSHR